LEFQRLESLNLKLLKI